MTKMMTLGAGFLVALFLIVLHLYPAATLFAQGAANVKQPAGEQKRTEQQVNGESLFMQRCALCHVNRKYKNGTQPTIGPDLSGLFGSATPAQEKALRDIILKGGPNMPGYRYAFDAKQMDDVISFLKTF